MDKHYDTETLIDYLHGALDAQTDAAIFAHLPACDACRAEYQAELTLGEALRSAARREERNLPVEVVARIRMATREERPVGGFSAWVRIRHLTWALPAAAVVALALWFGGNDLRGGTAPTPAIDASYYFEAHDAQTRTIPDGEHNPPVAFASTPTHSHSDAALVAPTETYFGMAVPGLSAEGPAN
jgi:anti-sigma factor RsiW